MQLSAPIYRLKHAAKVLARAERIPLHQALDLIAAREGFASWGLLASKLSMATPAQKLFQRSAPGDLVLIGARPRQGKTKMSFELVVEALSAGNRCVFFSLEYTQTDVLERLRAASGNRTHLGQLFEFDVSDEICADYIIERLRDASRGTLAVIDYLQLLDRRRETPTLNEQVRKLRTFARARGLIFVFISQVSRSYDPSKKSCPDISDVRLSSPLELDAFTKTCFLHDGQIRVGDPKIRRRI